MGTIPRVWSAKLAAALSLGGGGVSPKDVLSGRLPRSFWAVFRRQKKTRNVSLSKLNLKK